MKNFCEYELVDIRTGIILAIGQRFKNFQTDVKYKKLGSFKPDVFGSNVITILARPLNICKRKCVLVYYVHRNPSNKLILLQDNIVTGVGQMLHLRGQQYTEHCDVSLDVVERFKNIEL